MKTGSEPSGAARTRAGERLWFGAVCIVTLLAYSRSFSSPFNLDDYAYVVGNRLMEDPSFAGFLDFAKARILSFATLALNFQVSGEEPFSYHVVNFAIHLLATLAVYQLVLALCRTPRLRDTALAAQPLPLAVAAAFVFACHPIQIQAVTYVVQRIASMATLFYVAAILLYVRARNAQQGLEDGRPALTFIGAALLALAAFLSKESSASLPLAIILTEWTFYPAQGATKRVRLLAPFLLLVVIIPLIWYVVDPWPRRAPPPDAPLVEQVSSFFSRLSLRAHPRGEVSPLQYFWTQCEVIPRYLRLVVLPWGFNIDHEVPLAQGPSLSVAVGFAFLAALLGFGLFALRRWQLVGFGIVWLFLALSVESSFFPIQDVMVEHRMYLAMPGIAIVVGVLYARLHRRRRALALIAGAVGVIVLCTLTFLRNELWRDPLRLWQDALAKSPGKPRVYANVGTALHHAGKLDEAIEHYCKALALEPNNQRTEGKIRVALEEKLEEITNEEDEGDQPFVLGQLAVGADGSVKAALPHPCPRGVPRE